jgi:hypothetical protein
MIKSILLAVILVVAAYFFVAWFPWIVIDWAQQRKFKRAKRRASEEDEWIFKI